MWIFLDNCSFLAERGFNVWNPHTDEKVCGDVWQLYFCSFIYLFFNIHRIPADVSFICNKQDPHSPRPWSRGVCPFSCFCSPVIPMPASFPQTFLLHTVQSIMWTTLVLTILPTCSADTCGKQESAWEVAHTRGTPTLNLRIVGAWVI